MCSHGLSAVAEGLKHRGIELRKRKRKLPNPKHPDRPYYRNLVLQNEWLRANIFDCLGNYLFCQECVKKALKISAQRLARQRSIKRSANTTPIVQMKKSEIEAENLKAFAVVPEALDATLKTWWETIPPDHLVDVRYPYEKHGLSGKVSNNAKLDARMDFFESC